MRITIKTKVGRLKAETSRHPSFAFLLAVFAAFFALTAGSSAEIIYVANWNNNSIQKFDSVTGSSLGFLATNISGGPQGLALDRMGNLYAVIWGSQSIVKYTPDGVASVFASGLQAPQHLAFDRAGNLYVGIGNISNKSALMKFTPDGIGSVFATNILNEPGELAFDKAGNLFVANSRGKTIHRFTPQGVGAVFATGFQFPFGLAFDDAGNLFVSDYWSRAVLKITVEGHRSAFATGLADPAGLAFDSEGNLYVADQWGGNYGRIVKVTPAGVSSVFAEIPLGGPASIAIQPLPKPLTPPSLTCPEPLTLECTNASATATLHVGVSDTNGLALQVIWIVDGTPYQTNNIPSGGTSTVSNVTFAATFGEGEHFVVVSASNGQTTPTSCSTKVTVGDTIPPIVRGVSATPDVLWPPNHRMIPVKVSVDAVDDCDLSPVARILQVMSNEPQAPFAPDWEITGLLSVKLRAERSGAADGRVYTIIVEAKDVSGNASTGLVHVIVPHDRNTRPLSNRKNLLLTSLNLFTNGNGHVLLNPATGPYAFGSPVQLTAVPGVNQVFTGWSGGASGNWNPLELILTGSTVITANFAPGSPTNPPVITQSPLSRTLSAGASTLLSFGVTGDGPLSYQWRLNSSPVPGATNPTLTLSGVTPAQAGRYEVVVSGASGSATSAPAAVALFGLDWTYIGGRRSPLLILDAAPGLGYRLEYSWELSATNWNLLSPLTMPGSRAYYTDSLDTNSFRKFYRAVPQ